MSAIDQYCEAIPAPGGQRGNADPDRGGVPIPAATRKALAKEGADGQAILALEGPASDAQAKKRGIRSGGSGSTPYTSLIDKSDSTRPSSNPIAAVTSGFGATGDTVGPLFGTVLLFFALVFFTMAWLRYRRRAQG